MYELFRVATEQEKEWGKYLVSKGTILGLNETIFEKHTEYRANKCLKMIGLRQVYEQKTNPCKWMDKWMHDDENQAKLQETESEAYVSKVAIHGDTKRILKGIKF